MNSKTVGFGIIGTGAIAGIHAQAIKAIKNAKLLGAYSLTAEKVNDFAAQYNCSAYQSLDDLLNMEGLDIVCICTPSGAHLEPALKAIAAGKHCLIEKPIEVTLAKTDEIIAAARAKNVTVAVVFPTRFYPGSQDLKKAVDHGRFGQLTLASAYVKWSRTPEYYASNKWRGTWELDGGGALMNQAIHNVDMLQWCMGPVESVMAIAGNAKHKNIEVEDTLVAILKFANGGMGTIECSTAVYPGAYKKLEIMGTAGTVVMEDNDIIQWQFADQTEQDNQINETKGSHNSSGGVSDPKAISYSGHQKQMENMINAIYNNGTLLIDGTEGRKSVEIVLAIYKSARTGQQVNLPL
jgi:UDP-N-acetyl-2-amino-2-deoxyglucuronate dehydrogenase